jgi:hypothetical protein
MDTDFAAAVAAGGVRMVYAIELQARSKKGPGLTEAFDVSL